MNGVQVSSKHSCWLQEHFDYFGLVVVGGQVESGPSMKSGQVNPLFIEKSLDFFTLDFVIICLIMFDLV